MSLITRFLGRKPADAASSSDQALVQSHEAIELAHHGRISVKEMLDRLASANLFFPLAGPPQMEGQRITSWTLATLSKADGSQWVVAFSNLDLAAAFTNQNPAYSHGLSVATKWALQAMPQAHGLVVNIGSASLFEWNAEGLLRYQSDVLAKGEP